MGDHGGGQFLVVGHARSYVKSESGLLNCPHD
jgi:hypothetical protein